MYVYQANITCNGMASLKLIPQNPDGQTVFPPVFQFFFHCVTSLSDIYQLPLTVSSSVLTQPHSAGFPHALWINSKKWLMSCHINIHTLYFWGHIQHFLAKVHYLLSLLSDWHYTVSTVLTIQFYLHTMWCLCMYLRLWWTHSQNSHTYRSSATLGLIEK
jgi:hypothetical protein